MSIGVAGRRFPSAKWSFTPGLAWRADQLQRALIGVLLGLRPRPEETAAVFFLRRARAVADFAKGQGLWSVRLAKRLLGWKEHLDRAADRPQRSWAALILPWKDSQWLQLRRMAVGSRLATGGRTDTRVHGGFVYKRWEDSIAAARKHSSAENSG